MADVAKRIAFKVVLMLGLGLLEVAGRATSVTTLPGHSPEAFASAIVSSAIRFCSPLV